MSQYDDGYRAGLEAAAKEAERSLAFHSYAGTLAAANIRSLSPPPSQSATQDPNLAFIGYPPSAIPKPPPPQPATQAYWCGITVNGVRCSLPYLHAGSCSFASPGDDAGRCAECGGTGLVAAPLASPIGKWPCLNCHGTGRAGGGHE